MLAHWPLGCINITGHNAGCRIQGSRVEAAAMAPDPNSSPLAFFGSELRRLRESAGLTQSDLAERTQYALATVSAYETAKRIPPRDFAERADGELHAAGHLVRLQGLVEQTSVLPWFRPRIEVERNASEIREYESYLVPGLLQTEDYMRCVIRAGRPAITAEERERAIALRLTRQTILEADASAPIDRPTDKRLWAIIDESALRRLVGSHTVMAAQMSHLLAMADQPNVTLQIIPEGEGVTCAYGRAFSILSAGNGPIVHLDEIMSARFVRDRDEVGRFSLIFDHLRANALTDSKSAEVIENMRQVYQNEPARIS
jgi:transcriptional regulator with XRE-family HTH domain